MKYQYSITIVDAKGQNQRYNGTAPDRVAAEKAACEKAGVPIGTEPVNCIRGEAVDFEV